MSNPWTILGLSPSASDAEVRRAYKNAALATHPDKTGRDTSAQFHAVQDAYETLRYAPYQTSPATSSSPGYPRARFTYSRRSMEDGMDGEKGNSSDSRNGTPQARPKFGEQTFGFRFDTYESSQEGIRCDRERYGASSCKRSAAGFTSFSSMSKEERDNERERLRRLVR